MALSAGQLAEAQQHLSRALAQARDDPDSGTLAALVANRLAGTYILLGDGEKVQALARWALDTGSLGATAAGQTRTLVAIGASQVAGPRAALAELEHLDADPADPARKQSALALTSRETEVAHLVGKGLSNPEIAAELFISRKAVEYHLGNIYAKSGLQGRQELRRFVGQWRQPTAV
jgi:DNA-binding CsgD family transcriptional regulator